MIVAELVVCGLEEGKLCYSRSRRCRLGRFGLGGMARLVGLLRMSRFRQTILLGCG